MILLLPTAREKYVIQALDYLGRKYGHGSICLLSPSGKYSQFLSHPGVKEVFHYKGTILDIQSLPAELRALPLEGVFSIRIFTSRMTYDNVDRFALSLGAPYRVINENGKIYNYTLLHLKKEFKKSILFLIIFISWILVTIYTSIRYGWIRSDWSGKGP